LKCSTLWSSARNTNDGRANPTDTRKRHYGTQGNHIKPKRLPSLPKQHALVFGTSVNLPTTFKVRNVWPLPASDDAKIRELWFHEAGRLATISLNTVQDFGL
jgi:hypothetical protein